MRTVLRGNTRHSFNRWAKGLTFASLLVGCGSGAERAKPAAAPQRPAAVSTPSSFEESSRSVTSIWKYVPVDSSWVWLDLAGMQAGALANVHASLADGFFRSMKADDGTCLVEEIGRATEFVFLRNDEVVIERLPTPQNELARCVEKMNDSLPFRSEPSRLGGRPFIPPNKSSAPLVVRDGPFLLVGPPKAVQRALSPQSERLQPPVTSRSRALANFELDQEHQGVKLFLHVRERDTHVGIQLEFRDASVEEAKKAELGFEKRIQQLLELFADLSDEDRKQLADAMNVSLEEFERRDIVQKLSSALAHADVARRGGQVDVDLQLAPEILNVALLERIALWAKMMVWNDELDRAI